MIRSFVILPEVPVEFVNQLFELRCLLSLSIVIVYCLFLSTFACAYKHGFDVCFFLAAHFHLSNRSWGEHY